MTWIVYALIVVLSAAGIHVFAKLSTGLIEPFFALVCTCAAALVVASGAFVLSGVGSNYQEGLQTKGIIYAGLVGTCIALAHLAIFFMYKAEAPVSLAVPIVRMGAAVVVIFVGVLFFQEHLKLINIAGIALSVLAIILMTR